MYFEIRICLITLVTIHDKTYSDIIRGCGYHYDDTNWDAEKEEFVDYEGYGVGCYHFQSWRKQKLGIKVFLFKS